MYCNNCGKQIPDGSTFCSSCGTQINEKSAWTQSKVEPIWESTSVQVSPELENNIIEEFESFGWELKSSQTIDTKNTHLESKFDALYSVTESTNYIKLVFRRNKNIKNYEKIKNLEYSFNNMYIRQQPKAPSIGWIICAILFFPLSTIPFIAIYLFKKKKYKDKCQIIKTTNIEACSLKEEARQLLIN